MIKTLRITSILAVIAAAILIKYLVFPMVVGSGGDERVDKVLDTLSVVDKFNEIKGTTTKPAGGENPPLVQQAIAFADYLAPDKPIGPRQPVDKASTIVPPPRYTTPKFKVFATTYFEGNPQLSQALIDEPGGGRRWVRQSGTVSGLLIEQVKDGVVIVKNDKDDTFEIEIESNSQAAPSKSSSPASRGTIGQSPRQPYSPNYSRSASVGSRLPSRISPTPESPDDSSAREKAADDLIQRLRVLQKSSTATDRARIDELISTFKPRITGEQDDNNPGNSGEKPESTVRDPNRPSSMISGGKIDTGAVKLEPEDETQK